MMTSSEDFTQRNEERRKTAVVRWIRRIALGLLMLLTTLAVTGLVYQAVATRNDRQEFPPPANWSLLMVTSCISIALAREVQR
jgi:putative copper export protein